MNKWTVTLHFGRDTIRVCEGLTREQARIILDNTVFDDTLGIMSCSMRPSKPEEEQVIRPIHTLDTPL